MFSGVYLVGFQHLPEDARRFFLSDADSVVPWAEHAFREIYNLRFSDEDYYIPENTNVTGATLRELIQTIDIVGDDELELTWPEFVEFQTGFPVNIPGAEILSWSIAAAQLSKQSHFVDDKEYRHFYRTFSHSIRKNHLSAQGAILMVVSGNWGNPMVTDTESSAQRTTFDINLLTNRDDWIIRPMDDDISSIGSLSASQASINLFEGGDIYVPALTSIAPGGDIELPTEGTDVENTEVAKTGNYATGELDVYRGYWSGRAGASFLTDINFF